MKAMVFAAGLGTRLQPLTNNIPKALVEVDGKPLLYYAILKLKTAGFKSIVVNVHHFAPSIVKYLSDNENFGIEIKISDETNNLLDTGGGLFNARDFLRTKEPFLVYNVDVLSDVNLQDLINAHLKSGAIATMAVMDRKTSRYLLFDDEDNLCGWRNKNEGKEITTRDCSNPKEMAFSGIQVLSPDVFSIYKPSAEKFPILDMYLNLSEKLEVKAFDHSNTLWFDLGKIPELDKAGELVRKMKF